MELINSNRVLFTRENKKKLKKIIKYCDCIEKYIPLLEKFEDRSLEGKIDLKKAKFVHFDNILKSKIIEEIYNNAEKSNINVVLLKGNVLNIIFGSIKQTSDIDILLVNNEKIDLEKVFNGFQSLEKEKSEFARKQQETFKHVKYKNQYVDLHYNLTNSIFFEIKKELILNNIQKLNNTKISVLSPELMIINYLLQMIMDGNVIHYSLVDINLISSFIVLDKDKLKSLLQEFDLTKFVRMFSRDLYIFLYPNDVPLTRLETITIRVFNSVYNKQPKQYGFIHKIKKTTLYIFTSSKPLKKIVNLYKSLYY